MVIEEGSLLASIYGLGETSERHHHRREFNPAYSGVLAATGLRYSGLSPDGRLVEAIEWPGHPFFIGTIYHPEFKSRPTRPHPLFLSFLKRAVERHKGVI